MNREIYLKNIADDLALLSRRVSVRNAISLYDINIVSESFYSELLNLINGWNLKNTNAIDKNAQAIDLSDDTNRIAVQVTILSAESPHACLWDEGISILLLCKFLENYIEFNDNLCTKGLIFQAFCGIIR